MLATLATWPKTPSEFATWSFAHMAHHRDIGRVLLQQYDIRVDEYALDPFDPQNMGNWPYLHQVMHQQMDKALGIDGFDLSEIDWEDEDRMMSWLAQNCNEHYQAGAILGLG